MTKSRRGAGAALAGLIALAIIGCNNDGEDGPDGASRDDAAVLVDVPSSNDDSAPTDASEAAADAGATLDDANTDSSQAGEINPPIDTPPTGELPAGDATADMTAVDAGVEHLSTAALVALSIAPRGLTVADSTTTALTATATYSDGTIRDVTADATWTSSRHDVAFVEDDGPTRGKTYAISAGSTTITAAIGMVRDAVAITVTGAQIVSLSVFPSPTLIDGQPQPLSAGAILINATSGEIRSVDVTAFATWTSSSPGISVSNSYGFRGWVGISWNVSGTVTATLGGSSATTTLSFANTDPYAFQITPRPRLVKGMPVHMNAVALVSDSTSIMHVPWMRWTSADAGVATFRNDEGLLMPLRVGQATLRIERDNIIGPDEIRLPVVDATLDTLEIEEMPARIAQKTFFGLRARGRFSDGISEDLTREVVWRSSDPNVGALAPNHTLQGGTLAALTPGLVVVTASYGGRSIARLIAVTEATPVALNLVPRNAIAAAWTYAVLDARATFSDGSVQDVTAQTAFVSSEPAAGAQHGIHLFATSTGRYKVTAAYEGVTGSTTVEVREAILESIAIDPAGRAVIVGSAVDFHAIGTFVDGYKRRFTQDLTDQVQWRSSSASVLGVGNLPAGRGFATAPGTASISARRYDVGHKIDIEVR